MGEVTDYIAGLDEPARTRLDGLRARALALVPGAEEGRSYGMAALRYRGRPLISVVATQRGYSLFPFSPEIVARVVAELPEADATKGGLRFTEANPLPDDVFDRIVLGRREQIDAALARR
jgi:uncharacterized protein YdhG (YjbR/CyaY superfamily)